MMLSEYFQKTKIKKSEFARAIKVSPGMVWQWINEVRPIAPKHCPAIENFTNRKVTRKDLRPEDWNQLWPDFIC